MYVAEAGEGRKTVSQFFGRSAKMEKKYGLD